MMKGDDIMSVYTATSIVSDLLKTYYSFMIEEKA